MSSLLRSICQMMTSEESDGKTTIYGQKDDEFHHQAVLGANELLVPAHLKITPQDKASVGESCTSCQMALNELQLLRKRLQEECACKSLNRSERRETSEQREVLSTNMETVLSTKEDELFDVIDGLKMSLEKAKERQFGLQQQLITERALRIEAIRMTEELQLKLTRHLCSHDREERDKEKEERSRLGANDDDDASKTTADQLRSLTSAADRVDATYAKMEFVCSRCQKRERQTKTLPLRSIDRRPPPRRTAVDIAGGGGGRFPAAATTAAAAAAAGRTAGGGFLPSSAISKAKSDRITAVDDQRLSPDFHQKQISNLIAKPDSAGSDGILVASTAKLEATRRDPPRIQDVAESREASPENSNKELPSIRNKETVTEFAKGFSVSLGTGLDDEMSSIPLLTQDSPSPSDNLEQSKTSEIILAVERNTKALESKWSNSSSSITSRLPNGGEKQHGKSKPQDDVAKRSSRGTNTATVTVSSNGSVTTYSGSNLSLWMQFGVGNEPEKIVAKQVKPCRLKKHQKQTADHDKFLVEATTSLRSSDNQAGQPKPRNKKELVFRRLRNRGFVDTDDTESHDQSTLYDMDVVKVYNHNDNQTAKERLNAHNIDSNKSSPSNSHQSSIFSKSTSIPSDVENQPGARNPSRNQPTCTHNGTSSQDNRAKTTAAFKSSAAAMEKTDDDVQLVIDSVKEYCSFQIPVSLTASPDIDNSPGPDSSVPSDVVDSAKRVEKEEELPQTDPTEPITPAAADSPRNAKAASYAAHCKAYRTYFEMLAEKTQTRESIQSTPRFICCEKKRQEKATAAAAAAAAPVEQSSCKSTSRPDPAAGFSGLEKTTNDKDPVSPSKLHFVSDESMITYLSGIRTNLHSESKNLKTFPNQTMDRVNHRRAGPLSNEEIITERQQSTARGSKTPTISDRNQPTRIGTASVHAGGVDTRGIEPVRRAESPTDGVFQAASKAPLGLDDRQLLATGSGQNVKNDIRHHYANMQPTSVGAHLDGRNPTTVHRLSRSRFLNLPDAVEKAGGGGPISSAADKEPTIDVGAERASSSSGPATDRVAQLKVMAAAVETPSVLVTKSPLDLFLASSSPADRVLNCSDFCETARSQCECRANGRGTSPSPDCTASDTRNGEEEEDDDQDETAEGETAAKRRHIRSADDASIVPSSVPPSGLLAVVVAPEVNAAGAGVGASTGGQDLLLDREQKPD